jgi:hypothetical protein
MRAERVTQRRFVSRSGFMLPSMRLYIILPEVDYHHQRPVFGISLPCLPCSCSTCPVITAAIVLLAVVLAIVTPTIMPYQ